MINYKEIFDNQAISYSAYRTLIDELLLDGKNTGSDHSEDLLNYSKLNVQRMRRVDKTAVLNAELASIIENLKLNYKFLVIAEGWCGDAAQIVPVFNKMAMQSDGKIDLKFVLRDQNLPLIDAYLTNGGRAIPILIVLNETADSVLASWGPRPQILKDILIGWKKEGIEMPELAEHLHGWYAKDKTQNTQAEMVEFLKGLEG
ncbi:thioredoxin family protein [Pedobacter changchengzhani]|uniref:Thioredoxin family protein n=1 Tax=Pedobacter changchengzhani TaxID=2529274 RepID=A0A4R5MQ86_9SPHI|nr:thioredoxin family protein [Pedobacter changchengzhani]TDG37974.1 thioredoxin family protein [Pedobacter changchengzhani]